MQVLWDRPATVAEVAARVKSNRPVHYSTVQTMLRILETKGYVTHEKSGRAFTYRAARRPDAGAAARIESPRLRTLQ